MAATRRCWRGSSQRRPQGIVGVNVGANKDSPDRTADYVEGVRRFYDVAELLRRQRVLAQHAGLARSAGAGRCSTISWRACWRRDRRWWRGQAEASDRGQAGSGYCRGRPGAGGRCPREPGRRRHCHRQYDALPRRACSDVALAQEAGGVSGRPLFHRSTVMLARVYRLTRGEDPADRHRRHRLRRHGHRQDRGRRHAAAALHRARSSRARASSPASSATSRNTPRSASSHGSPMPPAAAPRNGRPSRWRSDGIRPRCRATPDDPLHKSTLRADADKPCPNLRPKNVGMQHQSAAHETRSAACRMLVGIISVSFAKIRHG